MKKRDSSGVGPGSAYIVPNVNRALRVLELLSAKEGGASITEISKELGFPKNSVFR